MDTMLVPPWLEPLLNTSFFHVCRIHGDAARSECNMFCLDCNCDAFCFYCRSSRHKDHQVIQIRRSSYHDVVRVAEIQKVLNISGVQTYVINSARVLFLNERPLPKSGKGVAHICEICVRNLLDPFRFCSLGCKLVRIKRNGDASFALDDRNEALPMEGGSRQQEENFVKAHNKTCIRGRIFHLLQTQGEEKAFPIGLLLAPNHYYFLLPSKLVHTPSVRIYKQKKTTFTLIKESS